MNKDLIELQVGCQSTCVIVLDSDYKKIGQVVSMDASIGNEYLFGGKMGEPIFKEKLDMLSSNGNITYFVIRKIDKLRVDVQNKYVGLVKDREFLGYNLPLNVIIAFTVEEKERLKNVSNELYNLSVVCF